MLLLQLTGDTVVYSVNSVADSLSVVTYAGKLLSMIDILLLPLIILCLFSAMKNLIAVGADKIDAIDFFAELAIDLLSVFSSFIIGRYFLENNTSSTLLTAFKIVGFMAVCVIALCFFRRKIMDLRGNSNHTKKGIAFWLVGEYSIDVVCLILIVIVL
jgi:hypothetical protein